MLDLFLESTQIVFIGIITATVWNAGKQPDIRLHPGWSFIFAGFVLLLFTMLFDVTDHFSHSDKVLVIGDTYYYAFLENTVGYLLGFFLLAVGFWKWMPAQIRLISTERAIGCSHSRLTRTVDKLKSLNYLLRQELNGRKQMELRILEEQEKFKTTLESIGDAVITTDITGIVEYINPIAEKIVGLQSSEACGQPLHKVFPVFDENTRVPLANFIQKCLTTGQNAALRDNVVLINRANQEYYLQNSVAPIRDRGGEVLGVVLAFTDVTESRRIARRLSYQASHDPLTDLVNRREFERRLQRVFENARTGDNTHALCFIDLDHFKVVNDACGHMAGDELLRQIGKLLKKTVRARDTVARLGGDEFALLMEHCSLEQAEYTVNILRQKIDDFQFVCANKKFQIGMSMGLVSISKYTKSVSEVLINADSACYRAKERGRNSLHIHRDEDRGLNTRRDETQWLSKIHRALENDRFVLFSQPILPINGQSSDMLCELLIRMKSEDNRLILPEIFMPFVERYNLAKSIDRWVVNKAFQWFSCHPNWLERVSLCTINLSAQTLGNEEFLVFLTDILKETEIQPSKICFEITETAAVADLGNAVEFIEKIKAFGCRFALDDFGSGHSSFAYLKNFPVDFLKIDGGFIKQLADDPIDQAMVKSINEIGHATGKITIAEGVENEKTLEKLREISVDYAQGYALGAPQPIDQMTNGETVTFRTAF